MHSRHKVSSRASRASSSSRSHPEQAPAPPGRGRELLPPPGEMHDIAQAVLNVPQFRPIAQPVPVQIRVRAGDPRQRLHQPYVEIGLDHSIQQHLGRVALPIGPDVRESGITQRRQVLVQLFRSNFGKRIGVRQRQKRRWEPIEIRCFSCQSLSPRPSALFQLRQIRLGDTESPRRLHLRRPPLLVRPSIAARSWI